MTGTVQLHLPDAPFATIAQVDSQALTKQDAVHLVVCAVHQQSSDPSGDFLSVIAKARALVAAGASRIVFLICGGPANNDLHRSLHSFSRHAGRAVAGKQVVFDTRILSGTDHDGTIAQALRILPDDDGGCENRMPTAVRPERRRVRLRHQSIALT
ncbi:MAG: hypothetical protein ACK4RZ_09410 [Paracoccaceae bacterium]